ncbi:carbohydrate-binding module family 12 protein [Backusella circina FSU 941]|nr:carbohydrate-binding module family 12 protein [Backusella circina FSU 941]
MLQGRSSCSLSINALGAGSLKKVQRVGKQDPYLQFSLDFEDKEKFNKTYTDKNAGETASWNQTFSIPISGEPDLFIEVLDEENTADEVIGFAAIPINQIVHADGGYVNGIFTIFDTKKEPAGEVHLQLAAVGFPNSQNPNWQGRPTRGQSYIHEGHLKRMTSNHKKQQGVAIGGALLGGALAIGAGYFGKKMYDKHEENKAEEERQQLEEQQRRENEERRRRDEQEKFNHDREEFNNERQRFEREKSDYEQSHQGGGHYERRQEHEHRQEHHEHHEHREHRHHGGGGDAERWNPVGTYAAGERVEYHGQVYMCLQGHTSNPTWQPGAAHSLWQAE